MNTPTTAVEAAVESVEVVADSRLASALRWLGGIAVLAAGAVFMLQGFENVTAELRNWTFIALMLACAGSAFLIQRFFADAKGARLLFGLALVLVPVQFSQLGGLLHELFVPMAQSGGVGVLQQWLPALGSPANLLTMLAVSIGVGLLVAKAGFTVLVRDQARPLTLYLAIFLAILLIPARESFLGLLVLLGMAAGYLLALRALDYRQPALQTFEGRSALALLALPLLIACVRFALHADGFGALCGMIGLASVLIAELPRRMLGLNWLTGTLALLGLFGAACSWSLYGLFSWQRLPDYLGESLIVLPIVAYWLESSRGLGGVGYLVRFFGSALMLLLAVSLFEHGAFASGLMMFVIASVFMAWSVWRRMREPTLFACAMLGLAIMQLLFLSLIDVNVNGWLLLAAGGLLLVMGAAAVEQYGRKLILNSKSAWSAVKQWS
ncbi:MAG: hypothetical protein ACR2PZ_05985 [Pseudomonadales bacterium]